MSAAAIAQLILLATDLVEKMIPILTEALKSGEISIEQQAELKAKIDSLKSKLMSGDLGSQWDVPDRGGAAELDG